MYWDCHCKYGTLHLLGGGDSPVDDQKGNPSQVSGHPRCHTVLAYLLRRVSAGADPIRGSGIRLFSAGGNGGHAACWLIQVCGLRIYSQSLTYLNIGPLPGSHPGRLVEARAEWRAQRRSEATTESSVLTV